MPERTTRERMLDRVRAEPRSVADLADTFAIRPRSVVDHLHHIDRSLGGTDEQLLVAPPQCRDCGFDAFDDPLGLPSRCPSCGEHRISDPVVRIE